MPDKTRSYRMQRRAESQQQTRLRITESAVALHGTVGPSRTSISAVAAHAGVRRSTVYRHFPDEAALFDACTAHWAAANPPPDLDAWSAIDSPTNACAWPSASSTPSTGEPSRCSTTSFATRRPCRSSRSGSPPSAATSRRRATRSWRDASSEAPPADAHEPPSDTRSPSPPGSPSSESRGSTTPTPPRSCARSWPPGLR